MFDGGTMKRISWIFLISPLVMVKDEILSVGEEINQAKILENNYKQANENTPE